MDPYVFMYFIQSIAFIKGILNYILYLKDLLLSLQSFLCFLQIQVFHLVSLQTKESKVHTIFLFLFKYLWNNIYFIIFTPNGIYCLYILFLFIFLIHLLDLGCFFSNNF